MRVAIPMRLCLVFLLFAVIASIFEYEALGRASEDVILSAHPEFPPVMYRIDERVCGVGPEFAEIILNTIEGLEQNYL